jgi:hypothetical protein
MQGRSRGPSWGSILAVMGVIATILGVITGLISLAQFAGQTVGGTNSANLSDQSVVATLGALQAAKDRAELQLTQYALAEQQSANQSTLNAINVVQANFQATVDAVNGKQDAFVSTQNAISGLTATADAAHAIGTQVALNAGATNAAVAQVTPTPTALPTSTPTPAPVADYRSLTGADVRGINDKKMDFSVQTAEAIPDQPPPGLAYAWLLDSDHNPATGLPVQDIGIDVRVTARFENGAWVGTLRPVQTDGSEGQALFFLDIRVNGNNLVADLDPSQMNLPASFDWVVRAQSDQETYQLFPPSGHFSLTP